MHVFLSCALCDIPYRAVGKLETFAEDMRYLEAATGFGGNITNRDRMNFRRRKKGTRLRIALVESILSALLLFLTKLMLFGLADVDVALLALLESVALVCYTGPKRKALEIFFVC